MIIAVTGYIGVGKTTVADMFGHNGYHVIEVDVVGHELLNRKDLIEKVRAQFGMEILGRDLLVDRHKLSQLVFSTEESLKRLSEIVHPHLREEVRQRIADTAGDIVIDAALYEELEITDLADHVILVTADIEKIYERMSPRYSKKEVLNVMNCQNIVSDPDFTIENDGTIEELEEKVVEILDKIRSDV